MKSADTTTKSAGPDEAAAARLLAAASTVLLSTLFTLTGVGTALLGSALPAFLAHWSLADRDGGLLFLLAWMGSTCGAWLSVGRPVSSVARGVTLAALACFGLMYAGRGSVFPLIFSYGVGLGITMTSISLLRSERETARRARELNRLNMLWALGALACPTLALHALRSSNAGYLFGGLGASLAVLALWTILAEPRVAAAAPAAIASMPAVLPPLPILLGLVSLLIVGVESAMGGWLTTYVQRAGHSVLGAVTAATAFWAGLLISRALYATRLAGGLPTRRVLSVHAGLVACCTLLVCLVPLGLLVLPVAFFAGFGLGPLYPLLLAQVLPRFRGTRVFVLAGVGSALFPWLTGVASTQTGSLRAGLAVPALGGCLLLVLLLRAGVLPDGRPRRTPLYRSTT